MNEEQAKALCTGCGRCCKWLLAFFPSTEDTVCASSFEEFMETRGCVRMALKDRPGLWAWLVPSTCPELDPDTFLCGIHATKPYVCRSWDPRLDPAAHGEPISCKWIGAA